MAQRGQESSRNLAHRKLLWDFCINFSGRVFGLLAVLSGLALSAFAIWSGYAGIGGMIAVSALGGSVVLALTKSPRKKASPPDQSASSRSKKENVKNKD